MVLIKVAVSASKNGLFVAANNFTPADHNNIDITFDFAFRKGYVSNAEKGESST